MLNMRMRRAHAPNVSEQTCAGRFLLHPAAYYNWKDRFQSCSATMNSTCSPSSMASRPLMNRLCGVERCGVWCVVCGVWCVVCSRPLMNRLCSVVRCSASCVVCHVFKATNEQVLWCVLCGVWCGVSCVLCVVCRVLYK